MKNPFDNDDENSTQPKSMKDLLAMFNGGGGGVARASKIPFTTKVTVIEEGNVGPGKAYKPKPSLSS